VASIAFPSLPDICAVIGPVAHLAAFP
jgi:hypothetical protein